MEMERDQFTFYKSFARAAARIRRSTDRCVFYDSVVAFALAGTQPDLDRVPESVAIALELVMPVLVASRRKAENGHRKGEANKSRPEANASSADANGESEEAREGPEQEEPSNKGEREIEKERENECSLPVTPSPRSAAPLPAPEDFFCGDLLSAVLDWLAYKREKRQSYKPTGLRSLFSQIQRAAQEHGDAAVADLIRNCMASGYQGLTLDRLQARPKSAKPAEPQSDLERKYDMMGRWANG